MKRQDVLFIIFAAFACSEEPTDPMSPRDAGTIRDGGPDRDAGSRDAGDEPTFRRMVDDHLFGEGEARNQIGAPDFESKLAGANWSAFSPDPNTVRQPALQRRFESNTPSARSEILVVSGSDDVPGGVVAYGFGWVTGTGYAASVWLGYESTLDPAPFTGQEVTLFGYDVTMGPVGVDLMRRPETAVVIDDIRWERFDILATGQFVGRITFAIQNYGSRPMYVNGPHLMSVSPRHGIDRSRRLTDLETRQLGRLRVDMPKPAARPTDLDRIGLPPHLSGR